MMYKKSNFVFVTILAVFVLLIAGCGGGVDSIIITVPTVTTADVSGVTHTTAHCGGIDISTGGAAVTARGVCWSTTNPTPTTADNTTNEGTGGTSFISPITGLTPNTTYYVRAYVTNSEGTSYGSVRPFTTLVPYGTVTDIDGNVYQTVKIGNQEWMAENLKVTHYRDGTSIPNVTVYAEWGNSTDGKYCNYDNNADYVAVYGRLYNWYAVADVRNIAPLGWHVPTETEWQQLEQFLGMDNVVVAMEDWRGDNNEGGRLKTSGIAPWYGSNEGATNSSGFSALPGGWRNVNGFYGEIRWTAFLWSATEHAIDTSTAWYRTLDCTHSGIRRSCIAKVEGFSVRCVKD